MSGTSSDWNAFYGSLTKGCLFFRPFPFWGQFSPESISTKGYSVFYNLNLNKLIWDSIATVMIQGFILLRLKFAIHFISKLQLLQEQVLSSILVFSHWQIQCANSMGLLSPSHSIAWSKSETKKYFWNNFPVPNQKKLWA